MNRVLARVDCSPGNSPHIGMRSNRRHFSRIALLAALTAGAANFASAQTAVSDISSFSNLLHGYNLITVGSGSNSINGYDVQGAVATYGSLSLTSTTIAANGGSDYTNYPALYVNGQLTLSGTSQLNNGYASTPNLSTAANSPWSSSSQYLLKNSSTGGVILNNTHASDPRSVAAPSGWDWASMNSTAKSVSNDLANQSVNGKISVSGQTLVLSANTGVTGAIVFDFNMHGTSTSGFYTSGSTMYYNGTMFTSVQFSVPTNDTFVVNLENATDGSTLFSNINFNMSNDDASRLLWNIIPSPDCGTNTETLSIGANGGNFYGAILAPMINLSNAGGSTLSGEVLSYTYQNSGDEMHYIAFAPGGLTGGGGGTLVPEPSTYGLGAVAVCGLAIFLRRRHQSSRAATNLAA